MVIVELAYISVTEALVLVEVVLGETPESNGEMFGKTSRTMTSAATATPIMPIALFTISRLLSSE